MQRLYGWAAALLRIAEILALCAALFWLIRSIGQVKPAQAAEILFAGTKDDADCAIFLSRGACVVIDTGEAQDGEHILSLLEEKDVETIDCLILTHPDKDHIGGAAQIFEKVPVKQVVAPYYTKNNTRYEDLQFQMANLSIPCITLLRGKELVFGELAFYIWPPEKLDYEGDNDYSLAVLVCHGSVRMFFGGDAQKQRIKEYMRYKIGKVDLYKVSYHGRDIAAQTLLIQELAPDYAIVTAKEAGEMTKQALEGVSAQIFFTREQDICFQSDGEKLILLETSFPEH